MRVQNNLLDWIRYILYTGAEEHRNQAVAERNDKTFPPSEWLLVNDCSSCHSFCTKDWYSALHVSTSISLVQAFSKSPTKGLLNNSKRATSSPPTKIAGQKLHTPCPMTDLEAKVDNNPITNPSGKRRASSKLCP